MAKTVLITGASTGIGLATAKLFQQRGWNVVATMRSLEKKSDLMTLDNTLCLRLDVTDSDSIAQAVTAALEKFSTIDVLVNNAGYLTSCTNLKKPILQRSRKTFRLFYSQQA